MKLVTLAFVTSVVSHASVQQEADSLLQITNKKESCEAPLGESCTPWNMTADVQGDQDWVDSAYEVFKKYEINEGAPSKDAAWIYRKCHHCTMVFRSTDSGCLMETIRGNPSGDWGNNFNYTPIQKWGLGLVHAGVAKELEGLLALMDFQEIRDGCWGSFSLAGHSSGGAMAQLLAVLLTKAHDPLGAKLTLHELNTFGSFAAVMDTIPGLTPSPVWNDQSVDGCFPGTQSWYAQTKPDGIYAVDIVNVQELGGDIFDPVRGSKVLHVDANGSITHQKYRCDRALPDATDLLAYVGDDFTAFLPLHDGYGQWLGCEDFLVKLQD